jgi:aminoglycoside 3-N-acetyltransferase
VKGAIVVTKEIIVKGLKELGLKKGDIVLVHSSLSSFGQVDGGADTVIDALLETVGKEGAIVVPTLTGSEKLSVENPPIFDVRNTPCWTGKIPETFRKRAAAIRSLHPTHSVAAIGAKAKYITDGHEKCITPCGRNSPYHKIAGADGYVLLLGVNLESCTMLHTAEELANVGYVLQNGIVEATVKDNKGIEQKIKIRIHKYGDERDFPKMEPMLMEKKIMAKGKIGNSDVRLIKAGQFLELTVEILKTNPDFLLQSVSPG